MTEHPPFPFVWLEGAMRPASSYWDKRCAERFEDGTVYKLEERHERSTNSHNHYHAAIKDAWDNLPPHELARFPSPDHLRKWALIKRGWCDERQHVCKSKAEALRLRAFVEPMDEYAIVIAVECVVTVYTAKSQSYRAMGKTDFQKSKDDVLDEVARLLAVSVGDLKRNAGQAA